MIKIGNLLKHPRVVRSLSGLDAKRFALLCEEFERLLEEEVIAHRKQRKFQRARGGGRRHQLPSASAKVLFILLYVRVYPTQEVAAALFGVAVGTINTWIHAYLPLLEQALGSKQVLPKRRINSIAEFLQEYPDVRDVIIDATERPVRRPSDPEQGKERYSGRKKRMMVKNTLLVDGRKRGKILAVGETVGARIHDKRDLESQDWIEQIPESVVVHVDLGYLGLEQEYGNISINYKKPRGGELSASQKRRNRVQSRYRVRVEHRIAEVKSYGSLSQVYRNRREGMEDQLMVIGCGLCNYRRTSLRALSK